MADWAELGFTTLPTLPREASSLAVTAEGEIVVVLANLDEDMDNTELRAKPERNAQDVSWTYRCTAENGILKRYFKC